MHPVRAIAFFEIGFQRAVDRLFRINGLIYPFSTNLRQPKLEGLGLGRRDRLNNAKELLFRGNVGQIKFAVFMRFQFQLRTVCKQLVGAFLFKPFFKTAQYVLAFRVMA